jgi:hypothetical protein
LFEHTGRAQYSTGAGSTRRSGDRVSLSAKFSQILSRLTTGPFGTAEYVFESREAFGGVCQTHCEKFLELVRHEQIGELVKLRWVERRMNSVFRTADLINLLPDGTSVTYRSLA